MKHLKRLPIVFLTTLYLLLLTFNSFAQNIGISAIGATPDESAILDLSSDDRGFLITRVDTSVIVEPAFGLMTLSPKDSCLYMQNGKKSGKTWISIGGVGEKCNIVETGFSCGADITDERDNQIYGTVQIGEQCWLSKNMNYTPSAGNTWCYNNSASNCGTYGRLYDWHTAMGGESSSNTNPSEVQGICPTGWHLPSDEEWKELELFIGIPATQVNNSGQRGTTQGDDLKVIGFAGGTNSTGFTALPGGYKNNSGFFSIETNAHWWTSTQSMSKGKAWQRYLRGGSKVDRLDFDQIIGASVRCVMD